jgi:predicted CoA-binding protein
VASEPVAPPDEVIRQLLLSRPVIAMVGASARPGRPSHGVLGALLAAGYEVIPVHPRHREVHGLAVYPDLESIPGKVDLVNVFRRSESTPEVARQAVAKGARVLWLQLGIVSWEAHRIARDAGMTVIMDRCLSVEHFRLIGRRHGPSVT